MGKKLEAGGEALNVLKSLKDNAYQSDDPIGPELTNYYGLKLPVELFLSRCKDESKKNNLYFTTKAVKDIGK